MKNQNLPEVGQVAVSDEVATSQRYDYADAFRVRLPQPDRDTPETWVGAGLDSSPAVVGWITSLLGIRSAPSTAANKLDGWRIVRSDAEVVHLEQSIPLMQVTVVGRNIGSSERMLTSVLCYERPVLARLIWAVVGLAHRRLARRAITTVVSTATGKVASQRAT